MRYCLGVSGGNERFSHCVQFARPPNPPPIPFLHLRGRSGYYSGHYGNQFARMAIFLGLGWEEKFVAARTPQPARQSRALPEMESNASRWKRRCLRRRLFAGKERRFIFSAGRRKGHSSRMRYPECCCNDWIRFGDQSRIPNSMDTAKDWIAGIRPESWRNTNAGR